MRLLESAVRDFGVGLVCIGGDQTYAAGGYRGTPLEETLPVEMELSSKKVLPNGALAIVCHATEFPGGNGWARDIAYAALDALGPQDEMGIVLWDGNNRWLFPLAKVGDKKEMGREISGMNPGDMVDFQRRWKWPTKLGSNPHANLKHMIVFSDGDPGAPTKSLVADIVKEKITISTVMIGGHVAPDTMSWLAAGGHGRSGPVDSASDLPQIFIKEASVILKSAIFEEPFKPQEQMSSEFVKGIGPQEFPNCCGYVCTTPKPRAEVPLVTQKAIPCWPTGNTAWAAPWPSPPTPSAKWAANWLGWDKYQQFWLQVAQWSLRRVDAADFTTEVAVEKGEGHISVEAVDATGNYRNFLNLNARRQPQGRKANHPPGTNRPRPLRRRLPHQGSRRLPDEPDRPRHRPIAGARLERQLFARIRRFRNRTSASCRLAEMGGGKMLDPQTDSPFLHDRQKTFQPLDLRDGSWNLPSCFSLWTWPCAASRSTATNGCGPCAPCAAGFSSGKASRAPKRPTPPSLTRRPARPASPGLTRSLPRPPPRVRAQQATASRLIFVLYYVGNETRASDDLIIRAGARGRLSLHRQRSWCMVTKSPARCAICPMAGSSWWPRAPGGVGGPPGGRPAVGCGPVYPAGTIGLDGAKNEFRGFEITH
jgi:uncharacterized membrane protein